MKKILTFLFFTPLFAAGLLAQSLEDFYDKQYLGVYYRNTHIDHTPVYPDTNYNYRYGSVLVDVRHSESKKRGGYYYWDPVLYNDMLGMVFAGMQKPKGKLIDNTVLTGGIFSWHNIGGNFIGTDKFVLAGGVNFSDFIFDSAADSAGIKQVRSLSAGYHFTIGPFANADVLVTNWLGLRCGANYNFSFGNYVERKWQKGVKKPHFLVITPEIFSKIGLFAKMSFASVIARADDLSIRRADLLLGWRFVF